MSYKSLFCKSILFLNFRNKVKDIKDGGWSKKNQWLPGFDLKKLATLKSATVVLAIPSAA